MSIDLKTEHMKTSAKTRIYISAGKSNWSLNNTIEFIQLIEPHLITHVQVQSSYGYKFILYLEKFDKHASSAEQIDKASFQFQESELVNPLQ